MQHDHRLLWREDQQIRQAVLISVHGGDRVGRSTLRPQVDGHALCGINRNIDGHQLHYKVLAILRYHRQVALAAEINKVDGDRGASGAQLHCKRESDRTIRPGFAAADNAFLLGKAEDNGSVLGWCYDDGVKVSKRWACHRCAESLGLLLSIGHHCIGQRVGGHHIGHAIGVDVGKHSASLAILRILKAPSHQAGVAGASTFNAAAPNAIEGHSLGGSLNGTNQGRCGVGEAHGADFTHRGHLKAHLRANKQFVALALGEPCAHGSGIFRNHANDVSGSVAVEIFKDHSHHTGSAGTEFGGSAGGVFVQWPDGNLAINNADQFLGASAHQVGNR